MATHRSALRQAGPVLAAAAVAGCPGESTGTGVDDDPIDAVPFPS